MEEVRQVRQSNRVVVELENILSMVKDAETGHRGYQLTHDSLFLEPYYNSLRRTPAELNLLDSLLVDNQQQESRANSLKTLVADQFAIIDSILANERFSNRRIETYQTSLLRAGKSNMDNIRRLVSRMSATEQDALKGRMVDETDFRSIAPFTLLAYALFALGGVTFLFSSTNKELTRRRKAEDALKRNIMALHKEAAIRQFTEKSLRSVLDSSLNGIMAFRSIRSEAGEIVDFEWIISNAIGAAVINSTEKNLVGKKLLEVMPEQMHNGFFEIYREVVETGKTAQFENLFQTLANDNWFLVTAVKLDDGFVITFSDITSQRLHLIQQEEREFLLREAEDIANMGSWSYDFKNRRMVWSDGLFKIYKQSKSQFNPQWESFMEFIYEEDKPEIREKLNRVLSLKDNFKLNFQALVGDQLKYFTMRGRPRVDVAGNFSGFFGTVEDVTEERINALRLKQQADDLKRSNEDLEQFAYVASHDLQEPLRKIRAFGDRLKSRYINQLDKTGTDYIIRMQKAAVRMQNLIEDLLSFSRVSQRTSVFEEVNLNRVVKECLEDLEIQIEQSKATIEVSLLPVVQGDENQVKRLFQNLLSNAIKFHHPDRHPVIQMTVAKVNGESAEKECNTSLRRSLYHRIVVKDNGIGFDQKFAEKIFSIFHRLHGVTEYEGTGIGLAICRKIATNHEGYIIAKSMEQVGAEFILFLPA